MPPSSGAHQYLRYLPAPATRYPRQAEVLYVVVILMLSIRIMHSERTPDKTAQRFKPEIDKPIGVYYNYHYDRRND